MGLDSFYFQVSENGSYPTASESRLMAEYATKREPSSCAKSYQLSVSGDGEKLA